MSLAQSHDVAEAVRHELLHGIRRLADATVHVSPVHDGHADPHGQTAHHFTSLGSGPPAQRAIGLLTAAWRRAGRSGDR
jgi:hypothetical protein